MTDNEYRTMYEISPQKAQTALFDEYLNYVYAIVYNKLRSCGNREDIEECVGDTFSAVFISYDREGKFNGDLKGFIGTVASRKAVQMFRRLSAKSNSTVYIEDETTEFADSQRIEENAERLEIRSLLLKLIKSLGEPESTMVIQKYYYNMNSTEIAQKHSMSPAVVRVKCSRALKKLKELLLKEGYDLKEGNI
ncbi:MULTISPECIES: RNA polymerase sigma factor [Ruminococcus]|uniref:RNA polymerase sigma-70 factor, ECF subfamily n=1 Tax=Ruminococcus flavefaciens TaxID=1265 RepID=A0A1M7J2B0_RUMFL|nr:MULTISPECIES: sigma-70 family RNA polymerase sigma factor [Ruminococcus]MCR4796240.1 sigma-70 family RNA polymerase sigma factor [Ruminococcus sp.]SHM47210.1 RNA polymerase sigma-70 factor, ECF subfamily [Ruminococcus flavefaciens]